MPERLAICVHVTGTRGIDNMQVLESQTGNEQHPAAHNREQNTAKLQDVVSRYLPMLCRRAHRYVGDEHDAEDSVQDALLSAYRHLDQFKGTAQMSTWLTTIVTNCALSQLRRRPRYLHVSLDESVAEDQESFVSDRLADVRPSPERECINSEMHTNLVQSVMGLSPSLRKVIQLCVLDGLTTKEAAKVLGLAQGTVKAQVSRARTRLKHIVNNV
jgi:RNA polymerase sigma-70 factor (ECF subfamily)